MKSRIAWPIALFGSVSGLLGLWFVILNGASFANIVSGFTGGSVVFGVSFSLVGGVIAARRPDNAVGWVLLVVGLSQGFDALATNYGEYALNASPPRPGATVALWIPQWTYAPGAALVGTLTLLLFPTGTPPSRRWRPIIWAIAVAVILLVVPIAVTTWSLTGRSLLRLTPDTASREVTRAMALQAAGLMIVAACMLASVSSLFVRYRRAQIMERQQLKWLIYAAVTTVAVLFAEFFLVEIDRAGYSSARTAISFVLLVTVIPSIPVAIGIAILKYRLYDIDRIINRTLVYVSVTGLLALLYAATVFALGTVVAGGANNSLLVAASTLLVAAAFHPVRSHVQSIVDRRFYRSRYDATRTIEAFATRLRDETDLGELTGDLLGVIREAVQAEHVSLWLRRTDQR